jgi:hypothetical protein
VPYESIQWNHLQHANVLIKSSVINELSSISDNGVAFHREQDVKAGLYNVFEMMTHAIKHKSNDEKIQSQNNSILSNK